ncbi:MAG TPA: M90 family metallopeptidase [Polyangiaceae bacterium]|nr:M90 family metallopeptidase [Polyangiaceae bacterium]
MFGWLAERRRRKLLEQPFPGTWTRILQRNMRHFSYLEQREATRLCQLVQVFVAEKWWEGCGGLELTDEIRVTIAGQACLLVLELPHELYANVETILVYPSTVLPKRADYSIYAAPQIVPDAGYLIGEAHRRGPIILSWDAVRRGGIHPEHGHNVVYHEFAHKLDMLDGAVDGVPPLATREQHARWVRVCKREYAALRAAFDQGIETFLDPYGLHDEGEFFAVITEAFFDAPGELLSEHPELYGVLAEFYRQDPAERLRRWQRLHGAEGPAAAERWGAGQRDD